jgi:hypothetical protein
MRENISVMMDRSRYEDENSLKEFLAGQLYKGRLSIVLGAGASIGFGLPDWDKLVKRAFDIVSAVRPGGITNEEAAEILLSSKCQKNEIQFAKLIHEALYQDFDVSFDSIRKNDLLSSIGAITMVSRRGSVSQIVSFNYDNLVESYFRYLGFDVESFSLMPAWDTRADVQVYHPHGILPQGSKDDIKSGIVFAQIHYDRIVGESKNLWRQLLLNIFRSNTCLFVGLSGADDNLSSILNEVKDSHASTGLHLYWGVRFSNDSNDPRRSKWEDRGVFQQTLSDYNQLPSWLFEICQRAAQKL